MPWVYNHDRDEFEVGIEKNCPRCKGFGAVFGDDEQCFLCDGSGLVVMAVSCSGWTRPVGAKEEESRLW